MTQAQPKTGPGGTEFLVRYRTLGKKGAPKNRFLAPLAPEDRTACHLRQAVKEAQLEGLREKVEKALQERRQFWIDTCREALTMRPPPRQVMELHRKYGWCFFTPSPQQVQYILDALDVALLGWDWNHPELFYQTLELNFPDLVRVRRAS